MAITGAMSRGESDQKDGHEDDLVMPGFRFHPTDEELVDFYLRRKVEGKHFNVELITFLDLYGHDPWELPALATIGEKEWFFYVLRDRKYRNGDRPNRVTTSGYWKATGADRTIQSEDLKPIGLKKTLVFYSGKAPKGIRTGWIMNEFRLPPQPEADRNHHKAEITLCRVYKRAGAVYRQHFAATNSSKASQPPLVAAAFTKASGKLQGRTLPRAKAACASSASPSASLSSALMEEEYLSKRRLHQQPIVFSSTAIPIQDGFASVDELNRIVSCLNQQTQLLPLHHMPPLSDAKLWDWNPFPFTDAPRDYSASYFK